MKDTIPWLLFTRQNIWEPLAAYDDGINAVYGKDATQVPPSPARPPLLALLGAESGSTMAHPASASAAAPAAAASAPAAAPTAPVPDADGPVSMGFITSQMAAMQQQMMSQMLQAMQVQQQQSPPQPTNRRLFGLAKPRTRPRPLALVAPTEAAAEPPAPAPPATAQPAAEPPAIH